jgi:hypothetical protein
MPSASGEPSDWIGVMAAAYTPDKVCGLVMFMIILEIAPTRSKKVVFAK